MREANAVMPATTASVIVTSADTHEGVQRAIDTVAARGGGYVDLGSKVYRCTQPLKLDSGLVSLVGHHAVLDFSEADPFDVTHALTVRQQVSQPATRGHNVTQEISGIILRGNPKLAVGLRFLQAQDVNGERAKISIRNCLVQGFQYGMKVEAGGFQTKVFFSDFCDCGTAALYRPYDAKSAEGMSFFGCTFYDSMRVLETHGPGSMWGFFGCSFLDMTQDYVRVKGGQAEFHGCTFAGAYPAVETPMVQASDDGVLYVFGGAINMRGENLVPFADGAVLNSVTRVNV